MKSRKLKGICRYHEVVFLRYIDSTPNKEDFSGMHVGDITISGNRRDQKVSFATQGGWKHNVSLDETLTKVDDTNTGVVDIRDHNKEVLYLNPHFKKVWKFPTPTNTFSQNEAHTIIANVLNGYGIHFKG